MNESDLPRCVLIGQYIVNNKCTVRQAASVFGICKTSVHRDVSERLKYENPCLYEEVRAILTDNYNDRCIRGGNVTKMRYAGIKKSCPKVRSRKKRCNSAK